MIYGRAGLPIVKILRRGRLSDVRRLDNRKPDNRDREAVRLGDYVVVTYGDDKEYLYHRAFLRADRGAAEIETAIEATGGAP